MTPNIALGAAASNVQTKSGERGGKNTAVDGRHFEEALAGGTGKRKVAEARSRDRELETRPLLKLETYGSKLNIGSPVAPQGTAHPEPLAGEETFALNEAADDAVFAEQDTHLPQGSPSAQETPDTPPETPDIPPETPDAAALSEALADNEPAVDEQPAPRGSNPEQAMPEALADEENESDEQSPPQGSDPALAMVEALAGEKAAAAAGKSQPPAEPASARAPDDTDGPARATETVRPTVATMAAATAAAAAAKPVSDQQQTRARAEMRPTASAPAPVVGDLRPEAKQPSAPVRGDVVQRPATVAAQGEVMKFVSARDGSFARSEAARLSPAAPDPVSARVNVLGFNLAPSPAPVAAPLLGATAAGLVSAIEADGAWRAIARDAAALAGQRGPGAASGFNTLRIQLQPAELGMVTARLVASGSQLTVEIQVESGDARQRLASDSEAIVKALRAVGYDIEKVTIQQASQNGQPGAQQGSAGRDQMFPDQQGDKSTKGRGGNGTAERDGKGAGHGSGEAAADRPGGGLYI